MHHKAQIGNDARPSRLVGLSRRGQGGFEMSHREDVLAAPVLQPADPLLHSAELVRVTLGRRGLVRQQRPRIVTRQGLQVTDGRLQLRAVRVGQGERGAEVVERLGVRENLARPVPRRAERHRRLRVPPRLPEMAGHGGHGRARHPCGATVQQASTGETGVGVDHPAHQLVREVVGQAPLDDETASDELLQGRDGLVVAAAAHGLHSGGVERATQHGRRRQHLTRGLAHPVEPRLENVLHSDGQCRGVVGTSGPQQLEQQQRHPLGHLPQLFECGRCEVAVTAAADQGSCRLLTQPVELEDGAATTTGHCGDVPPEQMAVRVRQHRSSSSGRPARRRRRPA